MTTDNTFSYNTIAQGGAAEITLRGGKSDCEGIVQVKIEEQLAISTATACSHEFGNVEAQVLCKQLGCPQQGERVHLSRYIALTC